MGALGRADGVGGGGLRARADDAGGLGALGGADGAGGGGWSALGGGRGGGGGDQGDGFGDVGYDAWVLADVGSADAG